MFYRFHKERVFLFCIMHSFSLTSLVLLFVVVVVKTNPATTNLSANKVTDKSGTAVVDPKINSLSQRIDSLESRISTLLTESQDSKSQIVDSTKLIRSLENRVSTLASETAQFTNYRTLFESHSRKLSTDLASVQKLYQDLEHSLVTHSRGFCDLFHTVVKLANNVEVIYSFLYHHTQYFTYNSIGTNVTFGLERHDTHFSCNKFR